MKRICSAEEDFKRHNEELKGTVMQIEKAQINDCLRFSKVS